MSSIIERFSNVNPFIIKNRFVNTKNHRKNKIEDLKHFLFHSVSILYIRGINKHTKVRNIDCVRASSLRCVNPFQERKMLARQ